MKVRYLSFLVDVLLCSLSAFGGPEVHISVFINNLSIKKGYLKEEEVLDLLALCSILPGPTSTQTITAIGYKLGGPLLGLLTLLIWTIPAITIMTLLAFLYIHYYISITSITESTKLLGAMAIGFIILASIKLGKKVIINKLTFLIFLLSGCAYLLIKSPWLIPLLLVIGGLITVIFYQNKTIQKPIKKNYVFHWPYIIIFILLALSAFFISHGQYPIFLTIFETFYRYGYLVFGGGQVVIPVMLTEMVDIKSWITIDQFLTGYGLVQGLPGPMFSFAAFVGVFISTSYNSLNQILSGVLAGISIFLPGTLLIYFIYPIWEEIRDNKYIKSSLYGIRSSAGGLLASSAIRLLYDNDFTIPNLLITAVTVLLLTVIKFPAPLIVLLVLIVGIII
ncbi:chromate efflux transporter [Spirochaeta cellobiosiphila]|uniref:chromate efflux transporter n=1 Tax=Spirochaeta cellobiosiphila TaxID=504483 RepID=UPI00041410CB|nr:chromate efflux transporter [Spirochaeta cellobiosiphila]